MMDMQNVIKLEEISEEEKLDILEVLKRNEALKENDSRRLEQLAVRVQMERMRDERTVEDEREILKKTGLWHRIRQSGSRPHNLPDGASCLQSAITHDLLKRKVASPIKTSRDDDSSVTDWVGKQATFTTDHVDVEPQMAQKHRDGEISTNFSFVIREIEQRKI